MPILARGLSFFFIMLFMSNAARAQVKAPAQPAGPQPSVQEWIDDFSGNALDKTKWELFTFEGGSGGKVEVKNNQLHLRGIGGSRWGVRSKQEFLGERFLFEATVGRVLAGLPNPGESQPPLGFATLTVLFDGSGRNRIEWILTSEKTFEAWSVVDGQGERLDNRKLGTKIASPKLGIARRGDEFFFLLNDQIGLQKTIRNMPRSFHAMLYGFGSSENDWKSVRVVTTKPS